jgi:hypothetical protein
MAMRNWYGALVAGGLVGLIAAGCSSSDNGGSSSDAGDAGHKMLDGTAITTDDGSTTILTMGDGTTGKACTNDASCVGDAGIGVNICSSDAIFTITGVDVQRWATPVCILPPPTTAGTGNCDPGADGLPHFCDGPDDLTAPGPGLCVPFDIANPQPGQGICLPLCTFGLDGAKPKGCIGTDTCYPVSLLRDPTTMAVTGYGFCAGGCQQDSDCTGLGNGYVCQTDIGYCTQKKLTRTKAIGTACKAATTAGTADDLACNCDADSMTGLGYCSTACVVGGVACPNGWVCDAGFTNPLEFTSSSSPTPIEVPVTAQNVGLPGVCRAPCTASDAGVVDAGTAPIADAGDDGGDAATTATTSDAGSAGCPPNTMCQTNNVVGSACIP